MNDKATALVEPPLNPLVAEATERRAAYRLRRSEYVFERIHPADQEIYLATGWSIDRAMKHRVVMKRLKRQSRMLEDRVWCLLYNMGYDTLNGENFSNAFGVHK